MSCSLIEAKFQILDRTIKMLSKSKNLRTPPVASSEQLRELVETRKPTSLLPTIKPVKGFVVTRSNQTQPSVNKRNRSQPNTSSDDRPDKKYGQCPPRPSTGRRDPHHSSTEEPTEKWIDPKQKRAEQLLQDTWNEIESAVNWGRDIRQLPRSKLLSDNYQDENLERDSNPCEERAEEKHASNQIIDESETISAAVHNALPPPKRPLTSAGSHPKKKKAFLSTRCRSAMLNCSDSQPKDWFAPTPVGINENAPKTKRRNRPRTAIGKDIKGNQKSIELPSPPRPEVVPTSRSVEVEVTGEPKGTYRAPVPNPVPKPDDPSFYMLELRLVHPEPLTNWRFQASFTDTSVDPSKTVILDDLTADDENCLHFDDPHGVAPSRHFNPFLYFPGLSRPSDLYGHVLHIIVTSLRPVTRVVINTSVQFTRFPDEAVVKPPAQSIRRYSEDKTQDANHLRAQPRRNRSASSASRRGVKVSKLKKKTPTPPQINHETSTSSLAMDQCNPWSSSEHNDVNSDSYQECVLERMFTLQIDEPRPLSPATPSDMGPTAENLVRSPRTPLATIDKKKMQLQRLRANIRREMSEQKIDNCNL